MEAQLGIVKYINHEPVKYSVILDITREEINYLKKVFPRAISDLVNSVIDQTEQAHEYLLIRETKIAEITEPMTIREVSDLLRGCDDTNIS